MMQANPRSFLAALWPNLRTRIKNLRTRIKNLRTRIKNLRTRINNILGNAGSRFLEVIFEHPLDAVGMVIALAALAQAVRLAQSSGMIAAPHSTDPAWQSASQMFAMTQGFWTAILPPQYGVWWLVIGGGLILTGIGLASRMVMLFGILVSMGFWSFVSVAVWIHLGFFASVTWIVWVLASGWVFDDVYRRRHETKAIEQEFEANLVLVAGVNELHDFENNLHKVELARMQRELETTRTELEERRNIGLSAPVHI